MNLDPEIQRIFESKEAQRKALAKLPFPEKIKIVIQLNELANAKRAGKVKFKVPLHRSDSKNS